VRCGTEGKRHRERHRKREKQKVREREENRGEETERKTLRWKKHYYSNCLFAFTVKGTLQYILQYNRHSYAKCLLPLFRLWEPTNKNAEQNR
jgi:hypothetical protein